MKDNVQRMERQAPDYENIFSKHITEERFACKILKELEKIHNKKNIPN